MKFSEALWELSEAVSLYLSKKSLPFCLIFPQKFYSHIESETRSRHNTFCCTINSVGHNMCLVAKNSLRHSKISVTYLHSITVSSFIWIHFQDWYITLHTTRNVLSNLIRNNVRVWVVACGRKAGNNV